MIAKQTLIKSADFSSSDTAVIYYLIGVNTIKVTPHVSGETVMTKENHTLNNL